MASYTSPDGGVFFDLATPAVGTQGTGFTGSIAAHNNGWNRCEVQWTTTTDGAGQIRIYPVDGDPEPDGVDIDNTSSVLAIGLQVEAGAYATSLVPSSGSTATRGAETLIDTTLSWWNGSGGTLYWEGAIYAPSGDHVLWQWDDDSDNERHRIWANGTTIKYTVTDGGSTVAELSLGTYTPGVPFKLAAAFAANDIAGIMSGGAIQTDASATLPTIDRCRYGHGRSGNQIDGWIDNVKFAGTRQDNTFLEGLVA
jgi:hypothetical protein